MMLNSSTWEVLIATGVLNDINVQIIAYFDLWGNLPASLSASKSAVRHLELRDAVSVALSEFVAKNSVLAYYCGRRMPITPE